MKYFLLLILSIYLPFSFASDIETIVKAKRVIKESAKDPNSVTFKNVIYNYTEAGGGVACGNFNAKNSFGAYAGFTRFISNGKTTFIEGNKDVDPPFPELWAMLCIKTTP